ncbi:1-acyl-sn-glycerol-3-phosphate acyltransferase [Limibacter armeniacum]|uniref:1-acyl-sn-glycerol-3-phosphate acyltransferase n=1 Tax=Limibacter armeniacum TaxID=466084 RepID=UPI002FE574FF
MNKLFVYLFKKAGWKVEGNLPKKEKKYLIVVAPHTSMLDFFVGIPTRIIAGFRVHFLVKKEMFYWPVGSVLKSLGGHPVDRVQKGGLVDQVVDMYNQHEEFAIAVTPEGTRDYNPKWKTGFYYIATKANIPIVPLGMDFSRKTVFIGKPLYTTGKMDRDMEVLKSFFRPLRGRHPEKGVI